MEDMIPCAIKDREVFQRVWQRVMEGRSEESSPIRPGIPGGWEGDVSCDCLEALMRQEGGGLPECQPEDQPVQPPQEECPGSPETPAEPEPPMEPQPENPPEEPEPPVQEPVEGAQDGYQFIVDELTSDQPAPEPSVEPETPAPGCSAGEELPQADGPHRENDLPQLWEEPQPADDRTARLRRHVMDALEGWQFYRHLARRARGTDARTLNSMAGEQHKEARKLSAAYFLLTGLRYWPSELLGTPAIPSYWGALRTRHQAEQRQENAYRMAADDWEDPDLLALYNELSEGCQRRSRQLRTLLEEGTT